MSEAVTMLVCDETGTVRPETVWEFRERMDARREVARRQREHDQAAYQSQTAAARRRPAPTARSPKTPARPEAAPLPAPVVQDPPVASVERMAPTPRAPRPAAQRPPAASPARTTTQLEKDWAAAITAVVAGQRVQDVAERLHRPVSTIYKWMAEAGVPPRHPRIDHAKIIATYQACGSLADTAAEHGCTTRHVRRVLTAAGVPLHDERARAARSAPAVPAPPQAVHAPPQVAERPPAAPPAHTPPPTTEAAKRSPEPALQDLLSEARLVVSGLLDAAAAIANAAGRIDPLIAAATTALAALPTREQ